MTSLPSPILRAEMTPYHSCLSPKLPDRHLHSCRLVPCHQRGPSCRIHRPTLVHVAPARDKKPSPRGTVLLPGPSLGPRAPGCTPRRVTADPAPFCSFDRSPSRRWPAASRPARAPSPAVPQARSPWRGGRAAVGGAPRAARGRRAGKAGSGPAALRLQPGRTAPTRRRRPRDGDGAPPTARRPFPARPFFPPALFVAERATPRTAP